jgi:hypothetical protein
MPASDDDVTRSGYRTQHVGCSFPRTQGTWQSLEFFASMVHTQVRDTVLRELRGLTALTTLWLGDCTQVTDAGLQHIKSLTALTTLHLSGTSTTQAGRNALKAAFRSHHVLMNRAAPRPTTVHARCEYMIALPLLRAWVGSEHSRGSCSRAHSCRLPCTAPAAPHRKPPFGSCHFA